MKNAKKISLYLLSALSLFILSIRLLQNNENNNIFKTEQQSTMEKPILIAHAGGEIQSYRYTNSQEAVERSISSGYTAIELDIRETSDGKLYAAHDPEDFRQAIGIEKSKKGEDKDPHSNQINGKLLHGKFTPLDATKINEILSKNPSIALITDKIRNYDAINKQFNSRNRIYIEVFSTKDYIRAIYHGVEHPMLNTRASWASRILIKLFDIKTITTNAKEVEENEHFFSKLKSEGVSVLVYTINDPAFILRYKNSISGVYSDNIDPTTGACQSNLCDTY